MRLPRQLRTPGSRPAQLPNTAPLLGRRLSSMRLGRMGWEAVQGLSRQLRPRSSKLPSSQLAIRAVRRRLDRPRELPGSPPTMPTSKAYLKTSGDTRTLEGQPTLACTIHIHKHACLCSALLHDCVS